VKRSNIVDVWKKEMSDG